MTIQYTHILVILASLLQYQYQGHSGLWGGSSIPAIQFCMVTAISHVCLFYWIIITGKWGNQNILI